MIYVNYPKRKKHQKGPILTLLHASTLKDWGWSPQKCSWDAVYPILVFHPDPPTPLFSLLAMSTPKFYPANLLLETQPHPFLAFFKPNLTLWHKLCHSKLAQRLPRSSLGTHALNLETLFALVLIKNKKGGENKFSFSHWKRVHFTLSRFEKFF